MRLSIFSLTLFLAFQTEAQVLDVNNDRVVGAEEAIAVAEQWKGAAVRPNDHNHLGQTWTGRRNPLTIQGDFSAPLVIGPLKTDSKGLRLRNSAPLILDNTATIQDGNHHPDLLLRGTIGMISADEHSGSELHLVANGNVWLWLDSDNDSPISTFTVINGERVPILGLFEDGDMGIAGTLTTAGGEFKIDHPQDPANRYLTHSSVESPERKNVYDGVAILDDGGNAVVQLPGYFESFNTDFRYQLTCVGGFAPVYVADKIKNNRFKIAGGNPNQEISWQVTGIRRDAYATSNPVEVEREKTGKEKGKYLHPEVFGAPVEKSLGAIPED